MNFYWLGRRIRTSVWWNQNPLPYHLATPQYRPFRPRRRGPYWRTRPGAIVCPLVEAMRSNGSVRRQPNDRSSASKKRDDGRYGIIFRPHPIAITRDGSAISSPPRRSQKSARPIAHAARRNAAGGRGNKNGSRPTPARMAANAMGGTRVQPCQGVAGKERHEKHDEPATQGCTQNEQRQDEHGIPSGQIDRTVQKSHQIV